MSTDAETPVVETIELRLDEAPAAETPPEGDTFPRSYVEQLRDDNARYRLAAQQSDTLASLLWERSREQAVSGILADPAALESDDSFYDDQGVPNLDAIREAALALADSRPALAAVRGSVSQGARPEPAEALGLFGLLKRNAG